MSDYVNSSLHELTTHGTKEFKAVIYGDSYRFCKDRFYYSHYHEEYEVLTVKNGDMDVLVNETTYHITEGDLLLINSNLVHCILHNAYPSSYVTAFVFHPSLISESGSSLIQGEISDSILSRSFEAIRIHEPALASEMNDLKDRQNKKEKGYQLDYLISLYKLFSYIYKNVEIVSKEQNPGNDRVRNALSFIYDNYNTEIGLSDIAGVMELSDGEASRVFKRQTGKSPIEYLVDYRINMASHYLKSTDKSITEIALLVGFSSSNYFTIAYKKINGETPKQFRERNKP